MGSDRLVFGRFNGQLLLGPEDFFRLQEEEVAIISNGCGSSGSMGGLVPDTAWGQDLSPACHVHDYMYQMCVGMIDEIISDCAFAFNLVMIVLMSDAGKFMKTMRLMRVFKYVTAVALTARSSSYWEQNQGDAKRSRFAEATIFRGN